MMMGTQVTHGIETNGGVGVDALSLTQMAVGLAVHMRHTHLVLGLTLHGLEHTDTQFTMYQTSHKSYAPCTGVDASWPIT